MATTLDEAADAIAIPGSITKTKKRLRLISVSQMLSWLILAPILHSFFSISILGQDNLKKISNPFVIIANHVSFYDSFLFRLLFDFRSNQLPLRFMAVKKFDWPILNFIASIGVIDFLYSIFGVFTVVPGLGPYDNLKEARTIIKNGDNVVIYPEGSIMSGDKIEKFKIGAAALAKQMNVPVLPISFRIIDKRSIRKKIVISVGHPIRIPPEMNAEHATNFFYDNLVKLHNGNLEE